MRTILLDCTLCRTGGGVQAGLSLLHFASRNTDFEWHAAVSETIDEQLPESARTGLQTILVDRSSGVGRIAFTWAMKQLQHRLRPSLTFSLFGPAYWYSNGPRLQGFAIPRLIYPEVTILNRTTKARLLDPWTYKLKQTALRKLGRRDWFVVETDVVRERLSQHYSISHDRIFVIRNTYSAIFARNLQLTQYAEHDVKRHRIIVPTSYYVHKNLEFIPLVAKELRKDLRDEFVFEFCIPEKHPGWRRINKLAADLGVKRYIRTCGAIPNAEFPKFYSCADAVFLPTLLECSSATYPEAFLAEVPVVTSERDFSRELCGSAALYADPLDPRPAAGQLIRALNEPNLRRQLVTQGQRVLEERYLLPEQKWSQQLRLIAQLASDK